jgi:hypothetical protein
MNTLTRKIAFTLSTSFIVVAAAMPAEASQPKALVLAPQTDSCLPEFGFSSFTIAGIGERVTFVRWGGLASQLGLEPGDVIVSMNGRPLTYHGAWNDALREAVANGGWVQLAIRDVRTGYLAFRETFVGGDYVDGPITSYHYSGAYAGSPYPGVIHQHRAGSATGAGAVRPHASANYSGDVNRTIKKIANLFD